MTEGNLDPIDIRTCCSPERVAEWLWTRGFGNDIRYRRQVADRLIKWRTKARTAGLSNDKFPDELTLDWMIPM